MANIISQTIAAATAGTLIFSAKQYLGSVICVVVSGSETANNNALRFYDIAADGTMTLLYGNALAGAISVACSVATASAEPKLTFTFTNAEDAAVTVSVVGFYTIN
jgi:uncharacterized membrane protein